MVWHILLHLRGIWCEKQGGSTVNSRLYLVKQSSLLEKAVSLFHYYIFWALTDTIWGIKRH
jgi:hypothetical protein